MAHGVGLLIGQPIQPDIPPRRERLERAPALVRVADDALLLIEYRLRRYPRERRHLAVLEQDALALRLALQILRQRRAPWISPWR